MKESLPKKGVALPAKKQSAQWLREKLFQQKKASQIRNIQFHGSRHRG